MRCRSAAAEGVCEMNGRRFSRFLVYFCLTLGAVVMLLPFFVMFNSAFKTTQ